MRFETFSSVEQIDRTLWNQMASHASPMMEWEYFYCLEKSGSVSPEKGYQPSHFILYDRERPLVLAPLFERERAWVEFGDGGLIELLTEMTGLPFHRGLLGMIPFTPVPAYQFLLGPNGEPMMAQKALLDQIDALCEAKHYVTSRIYFVSPAAHQLHTLLHQQGYICLRSDYCLWMNRNYGEFDDFLKTFRSNRRTKIKRELRSIREQGITIEMIPGEEAPATYYDQMFDYYTNTWTRHMGRELRAFLNEDFFRLLGKEFRQRTSFSVARRNGAIVGLAIFYQKAGHLYGRYWGAFEEIPFLHFATCYYYPIKYAIEHQFQMMDPGFGGEHKLYRGYETVPAYHYIKFHGATERRVAYSILNQIQTRSTKESQGR
jgi:uncharacterized protein